MMWQSSASSIAPSPPSRQARSARLNACGRSSRCWTIVAALVSRIAAARGSARSSSFAPSIISVSALVVSSLLEGDECPSSLRLGTLLGVEIACDRLLQQCACALVSSGPARGITGACQAPRTCSWLGRQACRALKSSGLGPHAAAAPGRFCGGNQRGGDLLVGRARRGGEMPGAPTRLAGRICPVGEGEVGLAALVLTGGAVDRRTRERDGRTRRPTRS